MNVREVEDKDIFFGDSSFRAHTYFIREIFSMKLKIDRENSYYFMKLGNTVLSQQGDALGAGAKPPKTSSN
jgi:hypothetical protein